MKILKSYYKTPSFLTGRCIVSLAILGLISCSDRNGKSLSEATNDPAGIYREYLYNIRCQKDSSFQVLTKHILQWQTVKDSVFRYLRNDTLSHSHSNQREECIRLHDSIRTEFSRLALSKTSSHLITMMRNCIMPLEKSARFSTHWIIFRFIRVTKRKSLRLTVCY